MLYNLDAITIEELEDHMDNGFDGVEGKDGIYMRKYADAARSARLSREAGNVEDALYFEGLMDEYYSEIDPDLRW